MTPLTEAMATIKDEVLTVSLRCWEDVIYWKNTTVWGGCNAVLENIKSKWRATTKSICETLLVVALSLAFMKKNCEIYLL